MAPATQIREPPVLPEGFPLRNSSRTIWAEDHHLELKGAIADQRAAASPDWVGGLVSVQLESALWLPTAELWRVAADDNRVAPLCAHSHVEFELHAWLD